MDAAAMRMDCARCAALCCVALAFDPSPEFAIAKPNGVPCPNLDADNHCRIYGEREQRGFRGCVTFDCLGAGQRVTQEVFGGRSWRDEPKLLPGMVEAFTTMVKVHETLVVLNEAGKAPLSESERHALKTLQDELSPADGWSAETLNQAADSGVFQRARAFLATLRHHFDNRE